jgi:transposase
MTTDEVTRYPSGAKRARADGYVSMQEAADRAGVSYSTVKRYVREGTVEPRIERSSRATGCRYLFNAADIQRICEVAEDNLCSVRIGLREYLEEKRRRRGKSRPKR